MGNSDDFGQAVSLDGNRLVVGALLGDGLNNSSSNSGDVYLYTFSDSTFSGGALAGMIGKGYTGGKNINQDISENNLFGYSVSLDGNRLAVGCLYCGLDTDGLGSGTVHLYTFTDSEFSGGALAATIGEGYSGGKNINQDLDEYDGFSAVSLDGNRLAVGAWIGSGNNNSKLYSGEVYLYTFSDSSFSGGALAGMIGDGYTGGKNINQTLDLYDGSASEISLDGNM